MSRRIREVVSFPFFLVFGALGVVGMAGCAALGFWIRGAEEKDAVKP